MENKPEVVELDIGHLEALLEKIAAVLGEEVAEPFRQLLNSYAQLSEALLDKEISVRRLREMLFGPKTERKQDILGKNSSSSPDDQDASSQQGEEAESPSHDEEKDEQNEPDKRRRRKGHGRNGADAYWGCMKIFVAHQSLNAGDCCPCCGGGKVYNHLDPSPLVRLIGQAPIGGKVYELERFRCHLCGAVFTAESPEEMEPNKYDATAASMIALLRYGLGMPWNRLAELQQSMGIPLPASTQWDVVREAAYGMVAVHQYLILKAAQGYLVHNDDTKMRILALMNQKTRADALTEDDPDRRGIYTSNILSICEGHSVSLFFTGTRHAGENLRRVLLNRAEELGPPIQMCDGLSHNLPKDLQVILANCLAHSRRKFVAVVKEFEEQVAYVVDALAVVYQVDTQAREENLSAEERLHLHQQQSGPVMDALHQWLEEQFEHKKVEPNSSLGGAIKFMLKHWSKLTLFLRKAGAPLDNNICERALKKAITHRKNSLFYKTPRGAYVGDLYMSLIHTCLLCHADPFDYLTQLQRHQKEVARTPEQWMPWNYRDQPSSARASPASSPTLTGISEATEPSANQSCVTR